MSPTMSKVDLGTWSMLVFLAVLGGWHGAATASGYQDVPARLESIGADVSLQFAKAATCARQARLERFLQQAKSDPASAFNSEATALMMSEEQRLELRRNVEFVERYAVDCHSMQEHVGSMNANLYDLAEAAARAGDRWAAACFLSGQWPVPAGTVEEEQLFAQWYAVSARRNLRNGIHAGDWKVVNAALANARSDHGHSRTWVRFSDREKFHLYWLSRMGSADPAWTHMLDQEIEALSTSLSAEEAVEIESVAASDFLNHFRGRHMDREDLQACEF